MSFYGLQPYHCCFQLYGGFIDFMALFLKNTKLKTMNNNLTYSGTGLSITEQEEGLRLKAYQDSGGIWTCGYGHTLNVSPSTVCTPELAAIWLASDTESAVAAVNRLVSVPLNQNEFDALVDFVFNLGATKFASSTMLDLLNKGDYSGAALQFERWDLCGGKVVAGLLNRRIVEKNEFNGVKQS